MASAVEPSPVLEPELNHTNAHQLLFAPIQELIKQVDSFGNVKGSTSALENGQYQGNLDNKRPTGFGQVKYPNGDVYTGYFENGLKHGLGLYTFADGSQYKGEFRLGEPSGKGVYTKANNEVYEGEFVNGSFFGYGKYYWPTGAQFEGHYFQQREGFGIYLWEDGIRYEGNWNDGKRDGRGRIYLLNGSFVRGEWKNGTRLEDTKQARQARREERKIKREEKKGSRYQQKSAREQALNDRQIEVELTIERLPNETDEQFKQRAQQEWQNFLEFRRQNREQKRKARAEALRRRQNESRLIHQQRINRQKALWRVQREEKRRRQLEEGREIVTSSSSSVSSPDQDDSSDSGDSDEWF